MDVQLPLVQLPDGFKSEVGLIYDVAKIGELTGKQQNYLMDIKGLKAGLGHIDKILEELVLGFYTQDNNQFQGPIKQALSKISVNDVETLLIKLRENTYGSKYLMKGICTHCEALNDMKLELSSLELIRSSDEDKSKIVDLVLPKSGKKAQITLMKLSCLQKTYRIFERQNSELLTATASLALKSLEAKENPSSEDLMSLPVLDIKYITEEYAKLGGKIDTTITHTCKECGKDFDTRLNVVDPNFFSLT